MADIKKHDTPKSSVLLDLFMSNNVFPLFVDEVEGTFFRNSSSDTKGAKFIKNVTNNFEQVHPCFIGSTNIKDFSTTHEIQRRLYYIELDNTFSNDKEKKQESIKHIDGLLGQVNDSLFRDFLYRLKTYTEPGMSLFLDVADMLAVARRIFREYYQMVGLPVPDYFPTGVYNDYYTKGRKLWQSAYFAHPEAFREYDDLISVDVGQLRNYKTEQAMLVNFLDVSCIRTADARNPILFKDKFFAFIGRDMSKRSRLKSWLGIKQRGFKDLD